MPSGRRRNLFYSAAPFFYDAGITAVFFYRFFKVDIRSSGFSAPKT